MKELSLWVVAAIVVYIIFSFLARVTGNINDELGSALLGLIIVIAFCIAGAVRFAWLLIGAWF